MWQDYVLTIIGFNFAIMLLPQVRSSFKGQHVNPLTSGLTALGLYIMCAVVITIDLYFTAFANFLAALAWSTIFVLERIKYGLAN